MTKKKVHLYIQVILWKNKPFSFLQYGSEHVMVQTPHNLHDFNMDFVV